MYGIMDLTHLNWCTSRPGGVSYGCFYKATSIEKGIKYYYKCSTYYPGKDVFGDESVYEVVCGRLFGLLGFNAVRHTLVYARVRIDGSDFLTYVCRSADYSKGCESRVTFEDYHRLHRDVQPERLISRLGISKGVRDMLVVDFLVIQRDRYGGNIELLKSGDKYVMAPLFDNGMSFLAPFPSSYGQDVSKFDPLADYPVNNYIGERSLYSNLGFIRNPVRVNRLMKEDRRRLFHNLGSVLPGAYLDKMWEIVTYRYMFLRKRGYIRDS